jgi:DNA-3-methyladenine glycosylase
MRKRAKALFFSYNGNVMRILPQAFFDRPALTVAEELIGKVLVRQNGSHVLAGIIMEVEAYDGPMDKACHAHHGRTSRNAPMFGPAGRWYVYFVYGMHWMLNIVTGPRGYPAAVLIRGIHLMGEDGKPSRRAQDACDGPAKLTKAMNIDKRLNNTSSSRASGLWVEDWGKRMSCREIERTPRIGVSYAGSWARKPYRFVLGREKTCAFSPDAGE